MAHPTHAHILEQTATPEPFITLADAKNHLRVDHDDDDILITSLIDAVTSAIDGETGLNGNYFANQKWLLKCNDAWESDIFGNPVIVLPKTPVKQIMSIQYYNSSNVLTTENLANWTLVTTSDIAYVMPNDNLQREEYSRIDSFQIEFQCGATIPHSLIQAAKIGLTALYDNRGEGDFNFPSAFYTLINLTRTGWIG